MQPLCKVCLLFQSSLNFYKFEMDCLFLNSQSSPSSLYPLFWFSFCVWFGFLRVLRAGKLQFLLSLWNCLLMSLWKPPCPGHHGCCCCCFSVHTQCLLIVAPFPSLTPLLALLTYSGAHTQVPFHIHVIWFSDLLSLTSLTGCPVDCIGDVIRTRQHFAALLPSNSCILSTLPPCSLNFGGEGA